MRRLYGHALSLGPTAEASGRSFIDANARLLGIDPSNLGPVQVQPVKYDPESDTAAFTLLSYPQLAFDTPVFRGELRLLARNAPGNPVIWANPSSLRTIGNFEPGEIEAENAQTRGHATARLSAPGMTEFTDAQPVVWAGVDDVATAPRLAIVFEGEGSSEGPPGHQRWLFVTDARTGELLHREDLILGVDVVGTVSGRATQGTGADLCGPEEPVRMSHARVSIGDTIAYADANGEFVIPNAGGDPVIVRSPVWGRWFRVFNEAGADTVLDLVVTPPGPADFLHNQINDDAFLRAEINAYVQANVVRDHALRFNPDYPVIHDQGEFSVIVNRNLSCGAFYDGSSIIFYRALSGCANTAFSAVVHHEYAHHLIASAGSGQGPYGEGMSDAIAVVISDDPGLGYGFLGDCETPIRSADNDCRYLVAGCSTCGGGAFSCGQVLSGCVWSTRNQLVVTEPEDYLDILSNLTVNSILLHTGSSIDPSITIDFLVLDDDDGNIFNGTPHYAEIAAGFGEHDMDAPPLCVADLDGDLDVDVTDLIQLLLAWGPCPQCPEDLTGDGVVDVVDLILLIQSWGPC